MGETKLLLSLVVLLLLLLLLLVLTSPTIPSGGDKEDGSFIYLVVTVV
jgi:hypothetical protein